MLGVVRFFTQIDIRYATIAEPDFSIRVHLVGIFIATVCQHVCNYTLYLMTLIDFMHVKADK